MNGDSKKKPLINLIKVTVDIDWDSLSILIPLIPPCGVTLFAFYLIETTNFNAPPPESYLKIAFILTILLFVAGSFWKVLKKDNKVIEQ